MMGAALLPLPLAAPCQSPLAPTNVYRLPPTQPNDLTGTQIKVKSDSVNLRIYTSYDQPGNVLHCFVAALKTYPHARRIRASWSMSIGMNEIDTTAVYDRRRHSLTVFEQGQGDLGVSHEHMRFTQVQDSTFVQLATAQRGGFSEPVWGWFDDLPKYGCHKRDLGSWSKRPIS